METEINITSVLDLDTLREQKDYLLSEYNNKKGREAELLLGLIHLINDLQDAAIDQGSSEMEVFGEELN